MAVSYTHLDVYKRQGLDGVVYLVDEGRSGSATGLRGQVMRLVGSILDPYFLLR